jgi:TPR repeat protein
LEDVKYNCNYKMNSVMEIKELKVQASRGESSAQLVLAAAYYNGDGVEQSYDAAFLLYKIAAERGNITSAWFMLGSMAQEGQGQAVYHQRADRSLHSIHRPTWQRKQCSGRRAPVAR